MCTNSLVVGDIVSDIRIKHSGNAQYEVVQAAMHMLGQFDRVNASREDMKCKVLTPGQSEAYARAALVARFDVETPEQAPLRVDQALAPRRFEDRKDDLWTTFNRVQENLVNGGQHYVARNRAGQRRNGTTRAVNGIDQQTTLNRALWTLAEALKAA